MSNAERIWAAAKAIGFTDAGAAAVCGNAQAESALIENNLENTKERPLGMNDAQYTAAVDNGSYSNFVHDSAGYGLFQWTLGTRKKELLEYVRERGVSISNVDAQLSFFQLEITRYFAALCSTLRTSNDVKLCSDCFMVQFENPADKSDSAKYGRYEKSLKFYNQFHGSTSVAPATPVFPPDLSIMVLQTVLNYNGYKCRSDGYKDAEFYAVLREFVTDIGG